MRIQVVSKSRVMSCTVHFCTSFLFSTILYTSSLYYDIISRMNDLTASVFDETKSVSQTLYNRGSGQDVVIEFLRECPKN